MKWNQDLFKEKARTRTELYSILVVEGIEGVIECSSLWEVIEWNEWSEVTNRPMTSPGRKKWKTGKNKILSSLKWNQLIFYQLRALGAQFIACSHDEGQCFLYVTVSLIAKLDLAVSMYLDSSWN